MLSTDGIATCTGDGLEYVVVWAIDSVAVSAPSGMLGRIYDRLGGTPLAVVFRDDDGSDMIDTGNSELDACHSALSDLCSYRGHS